MKQIFILQIIDLSLGSTRIAQYAYRTKIEALKQIAHLQNAYAEVDGITIQSVYKRYVFNVVAVYVI